MRYRFIVNCLNEKFLSFIVFLPGGGRLSKAFRHKGRRVMCAATFFTILPLALLLNGCARDANVYHWDSPEEALDCYQDFCMKLSREGGSSMEEIEGGIVQWLEMEDAVLSCLRRDTAAAMGSRQSPAERLKSLSRRAQDEFINKIKAMPRTLDDVLSLKSYVIARRHDPGAKAVAGAVAPFFESLDGISIYNDRPGALMRRYREFLDITEWRGIYKFTELRAFMREEDRMYRSFLSRRSEMDSIPLSDIGQSTNRIYDRSRRFLATDSLRRDTMTVMMAMRSNRRLLQGAEACLKDIREGRVESAPMRRSCYRMMLRPFVSMDNLGYSVLSEKERKRLGRLAGDVPPVAREIEAEEKDGEAVMDRLPELLIRSFISSL